MSPMLPALPQAWMRHAMNIAVSLLYLCGILNLFSGTLQLFALSLAVYYMVKYRVGGAEKMPWIVFAVVMTHMTITCVYVRMCG